VNAPFGFTVHLNASLISKICLIQLRIHRKTAILPTNGSLYNSPDSTDIPWQLPILISANCTVLEELFPGSSIFRQSTKTHHQNSQPSSNGTCFPFPTFLGRNHTNTSYHVFIHPKMVRIILTNDHYLH
jgi:hypothetical protein